MKDEALLRAIARSLQDLEDANELVVCAASTDRAASVIHDAVLAIVPRSDLAQDDLSAIRSLIFETVADKRFFDWEMPTLTGKTADDSAM
ncbi:hypothetical protein [Ensifer sp. LCM 4579]|uniref:hypothetical protein n=1 Tax=Ensifer sp. LCM 4579 TaxID=1848292 RepID=UPI0008D987F6|nr:hypothetical protein [Ensifer sp. LCM 4579]OHV80380.1 hypothetical protein LCM4579_22610 [Ensifer sp. LCM 4579]